MSASPEPSTAQPATEPASAPDPVAPPMRILDYREELSPLERAAIFAVRKSFDVAPVHRVIRWLQTAVSPRWILGATANVRHVHGLSRLPALDQKKSYIVVANHRSFFDLYVVTALLVRHGLRHRMLFPVRSGFWYDHQLGPVVNGAMSVLAMYPPIFRDRGRDLNVAGLAEVVELMSRGGTFLGIHPEGRRKLDDDPYTFLPAQPGVGRIVRRTDAIVIPVYVNGLLNDIVKQISGNFQRSIPDFHVVFGEPIDFDDLRAAPDESETHRAIATRSMDVIAALSVEEREIRAGRLKIA